MTKKGVSSKKGDGAVLRHGRFFVFRRLRSRRYNQENENAGAAPLWRSVW